MWFIVVESKNSKSTVFIGSSEDQVKAQAKPVAEALGWLLRVVSAACYINLTPEQESKTLTCWRGLPNHTVYDCRS